MFRFEGSVIAKHVDKANIFIGNFASNSNVDSAGVPPLPQPVIFSEPLIQSLILTVCEAQRALALVDIHKPYGPDGIPHILLREFSGTFSGFSKALSSLLQNM